MVVVRDVAHEDTDLAVVNLPSMAAPLALHPRRVRTAFGEATGIEGDDAIGFAQPLDHLSDQHRDQWPVVPERGTNEVLDDLSLDIDQGGDFLGILAWQMGEQPLKVERHGVLADLGLKRLLIGHDERAQTIHHLVEDVGGDETIAQYFLSPLCPHGHHLFASSHWSIPIGFLLEAIVITICYVMQQGSKEEIQ